MSYSDAIIYFMSTLSRAIYLAANAAVEGIKGWANEVVTDTRLLSINDITSILTNLLVTFMRKLMQKLPSITLAYQLPGQARSGVLAVLSVLGPALSKASDITKATIPLLSGWLRDSYTSLVVSEYAYFVNEHFHHLSQASLDAMLRGWHAVASRSSFLSVPVWIFVALLALCCGLAFFWPPRAQASSPARETQPEDLIQHISDISREVKTLRRKLVQLEHGLARKQPGVEAEVRELHERIYQLTQMVQRHRGSGRYIYM